MTRPNSCPVCGSANTAPRMERPVGRLLRCHGCSHTFTVFAPGFSETYDESYFTDRHKNWFAHPDRRLFRRIEEVAERFASSGGHPRLLDLGCGRGAFLRFLATRRLEWQLTGIDISPNQHERIRFFQGDMFQYPFEEGAFDVVCSLAVVEHIDNPVEFARKCAQLVRPGGLACVMTVNDDSLLYGLARAAARTPGYYVADRLYFSHHLQHFTHSSLRRLFEEAGLTTLQQFSHNYPLKAIDVPPGPVAVERLSRLAAAAVFLASELTGQGMLQTWIGRKLR